MNRRKLKALSAAAAAGIASAMLVMSGSAARAGGLQLVHGQTAIDRANAIVQADYAAEYGGVWLDAKGLGHVGVTAHASDVADALLRAGVGPTAVRVDQVRFAWSQLEKIQSEITAEMKTIDAATDTRIVLVGLQTDRNRVIVGVTNVNRAIASTLGQRFGTAVGVEKHDPFVSARSRSNWPPPWAGGIRINGTPGVDQGQLGYTYCTGGFNLVDFVTYKGVQYQLHYLGTTGHCFVYNTKVFNGSGSAPTLYPIGYVAFRNWAPDTYVDFEAIEEAPQTQSNYITTSGSNMLQIQGASTPYVGEPVKKSGVTTGNSSGTVTAVRTTIEVDEPQLGTTYTVHNEDCASPLTTSYGDSGAPVYDTTRGSSVYFADGFDSAFTASDACFADIQAVHAKSGYYIWTFPPKA
ncbi:MAG: hypothetical protein ACJ735_04975 [Actinomycetes bacterium]